MQAVHTYTHTHPFNGPFSELPRWAGTRKGKPIWILLKHETVSGSGISWAMCKSPPRSRQITTPAPHHSVFYRPGALLAAQPTVSKHWRQYILIQNTQKRFAAQFSYREINLSRLFLSIAYTARLDRSIKVYFWQWQFLTTSMFSVLTINVALPTSHHFHPSLSPVVSLSLDILHECRMDENAEAIAKPSSDLLQRTGGDHRGGRAHNLDEERSWWPVFAGSWDTRGWLEIWRRIGLSGDWCLCTALLDCVSK